MFRPLNDQVLVELEDAPQRSSILHTLVESNARVGKVISVGPGKYYEDAGYVPTEVKPGDRVAFNYLYKLTKNGSRVYEWLGVNEGKERFILRESDILFVLEGEGPTPFVEMQ